MAGLKRIERLPQQDCAILYLPVRAAPAISTLVDSQCLMFAGAVKHALSLCGQPFLNPFPPMAVVSLLIRAELRYHREYWNTAFENRSINFLPSFYFFLTENGLHGQSPVG